VFRDVSKPKIRCIECLDIDMYKVVKHYECLKLEKILESFKYSQ